ncbi:hypothetical protein ACWY2R_07080 [Enterococcus avium]
MELDINIFLNLLIPVITSFLVCFITMYITNKQHQKSLKQQEFQHKEVLELSKEQYREERYRSQERERLSYLPYLTLIPKIWKNRFSGGMDKHENNDHFFIPFELENEGLGEAFSIDLVYLEKVFQPEKSQLFPQSLLSIKDNYGNNYDVLGVSSPIDTDILKVAKKTEFELYVGTYDTDWNAGTLGAPVKWEIKIRFEDFQYRKYEQRYSFITSGDFQEVHRINSNRPKLIKNKENNSI